MEFSSTSAARPKRGKKTNKSAETNKEGEHGTVTQLAPTAVMSLKKHQILLAEAKKKEEAMSKTIADLKEERDSLLKQLDESGNPQQTVRRYKKILHQYRRGKNLRDAYRAVGVDRNTVVANAPIAELAIVAPQEYRTELEGYSRQEKLQVFAKKCADVLNNDVQLLNNVEMYKKKNKLLPLMKRK